MSPPYQSSTLPLSAVVSGLIQPPYQSFYVHGSSSPDAISAPFPIDTHHLPVQLAPLTLTTLTNSSPPIPPRRSSLSTGNDVDIVDQRMVNTPAVTLGPSAPTSDSEMGATGASVATPTGSLLKTAMEGSPSPFSALNAIS